MADNFNVRKVTKIWTATNAQLNEALTPIFRVNYGDIVLHTVARVIVASDRTTPKVFLGDSAVTNRYLTDAEIDIANAALVTGSGTNDLAGAGYYVYQDVANVNTIDVSFTGGAADGTLANKPRVRFTAWILDSEPV